MILHAHLCGVVQSLQGIMMVSAVHPAANNYNSSQVKKAGRQERSLLSSCLRQESQKKARKSKREVKEGKKVKSDKKSRVHLHLLLCTLTYESRDA
jgi:hypothetical protein